MHDKYCPNNASQFPNDSVPYLCETRTCLRKRNAPTTMADIELEQSTQVEGTKGKGKQI